MSTTDDSPRLEAALSLRHMLTPSDCDAIRALVAATGKFTPAEIEVAVELVRENLARGEESGYWFTVAEMQGEVVGYAAFGPTPCTAASFDLYWIAVHPSFQGRRIGRHLLSHAEARIRLAGGRRVYIDTSGRRAYEPTRAFYERAGYVRQALLPDFYADGDSKIIYAKLLD